MLELKHLLLNTYNFTANVIQQITGIFVKICEIKFQTKLSGCT